MAPWHAVRFFLHNHFSGFLVLMIAAIALVLAFRSSSNLVAAYGVSVNATMLVTTILAFYVARERGGWHLWKAGLFLLVFLSVDLMLRNTMHATSLYRIPSGRVMEIGLQLGI